MPSDPSDASERSATIAGIVEALQAERAGEALERTVAALGAAPQDAALNELAALAALAAGQPARAKDFARRSLAVRPSHPGASVALGRALRSLGRPGEAAVALTQAVAAAPGVARPLFLLCAAWLEAADGRAMSLVDDLLARFPGEAGGWEEIGTVLARLGKPQAALACFARAFQAEPGFALAMRIGLIQRDLGRPGEAAIAFRQATECAPGAVRAWFLLGLSLQDNGDRAGAISAYRAALQRDPASAEAAVNLGTVLQENGDLDGAKTAYSCAITIRADTFGRIAQAMTSAPRGELWLDLGRLRGLLGG